MEPMTLGSPVQSPTNNPSNFGSPFLPAYLMGEQLLTSTPRPRHSNLSQTKTSLTLSNSLQETPEGTFHKQNLFSNSFAIQETANLNNTKFVATEKTGPPVQGLFDTLDAKYKYEQKDALKNSSFQETSTYNTPRNFDDNAVNSAMKIRPIQLDVNQSLSKANFSHVYNSNASFNQNGSSNWITVFGFAPSCINMIIKQFSQCGSIIDKRIPNQGNWLHLKYSSQIDAEKAVALNGKVLLNSIMIGVIAYEPNEHKENLSSYIEDQSSINTSYNIRCAPTPNRARHLTQSFLSPQNQSNITNELTSSQVPQKSTGIVTKAMEYVFGW